MHNYTTKRRVGKTHASKLFILISTAVSVVLASIIGVVAPVQAAVPAAPVITGAQISSGLAFTIDFKLGAFSGAVTKYEYSTDNGSTFRETETIAACVAGATCQVEITDESDTLNPLSYGKDYQVKIRVTNVDGSATSAAWPVYFITTPQAPALSGATPGSGFVTLSFALGASGGADITSIEYTTDGGTSWRNANCASCASATSVVVTTTSGGAALVSGTTYSFKIRAKNKVGASAASATLTATPGAVPAAMTISSVVGGVDSLIVSSTLGANNYGAVIDVEYSTDNGSTWRTSGGVSGNFTITSTSGTGEAVAGGTSYTVKVRAVNAIGASAASNGKAGTPIGDPMPSTLDSATASGNSISIKSTNGLLMGGTFESSTPQTVVPPGPPRDKPLELSPSRVHLMPKTHRLKRGWLTP
jgi:titin